MQIEADALQFLGLDSNIPSETTLPTAPPHKLYKQDVTRPFSRVQPQEATLLLRRHGEKAQAHDDELGQHKHNGQR